MNPRGERIGGRYVLEAKLGEGRGGQVFVARDSRTNARIALKLRETTLDAETDIERGGLRSIEHPHLLRVLDAGDDRGRPFVVTELVEGGSLADLPKPLPSGTLQLVASQMLEALAFLHAQGILHGDVKPENILVASLEPPSFKLADFGLSQRSVDVAAGTTRGSPAFMPPEIIRGEPADERSDLYSLGVALYECAFGELPFEDADVRTLLMRHLTEVPHRLQGPSDIDPRLSSLLRRLLAKEPAERPPDARAALAQWRGDEAAAPRWIPPRLGVLIGRDAELAELERALESDTAVVSIEGPAGIGKTRLMRELALRAELRGTPTFWWTPAGLVGSTSGVTSNSPERAGVHTSAVDAAESRARSVLAMLGESRHALFIDDLEDLPLWFLDSVALVVRDLAARPSPGRLVCVAGREDAAGWVNQSLEAGGFQQQPILHLRPWPRTSMEAACSALFGAKRLHGRLLDLLEVVTGGVPAETEVVCQCLVERDLLRMDTSGAVTTAAETTPESVTLPGVARTAATLARCSAEQTLTLRIIALLRNPATVGFLQATCGLRAGDLLTLQRLGLVIALPNNLLTLPHAGLRSAVLQGLAAEETRTLHDRVADFLEEKPELLPREDATFHRALGGVFDVGLRAAQSLAARFRDSANPEILKTVYDSVLDIWPDGQDPHGRAETELQLLDTLLCLGEYDGVHRLTLEFRQEPRFRDGIEALARRSAEAHLARGESELALAVLEEVCGQQLTPRSMLARARALAMQGNHSKAAEICQALAAEADVLLAPAVVELEATCMRSLGKVAAAEEFLTSAIKAGREDVPQRNIASLLANLGLVQFYQGRMVEAERSFERSLELFSLTGDRYGTARVLNSLAATAGETGRYSESAERLRSALDLCRRLGETESASSILANLAQLLMLQASYREGLQRASEARELSRRRNLRSMYVQSQIVHGGILAALGMEKECREELADLLEETRGSPQEGQILLLWSGLSLQRGDLEPIGQWLERARTVLEAASAEDELVVHDLTHSRFLEASGDVERAVKLARSAADQAARLRLVSPALDARVWLAELLRPVAKEEALSLASGALEASRHSGLREFSWRAERTLGQLALSEADLEGAFIHYESAVRTLQEIAGDLPAELVESYIALPELGRLFREVRQLRAQLESES